VFKAHSTRPATGEADDCVIDDGCWLRDVVVGQLKTNEQRLLFLRRHRNNMVRCLRTTAGPSSANIPPQAGGSGWTEQAGRSRGRGRRAVRAAREKWARRQ